MIEFGNVNWFFGQQAFFIHWMRFFFLIGNVSNANIDFDMNKSHGEPKRASIS